MPAFSFFSAADNGRAAVGNDPHGFCDPVGFGAVAGAFNENGSPGCDITYPVGPLLVWEIVGAVLNRSRIIEIHPDRLRKTNGVRGNAVGDDYERVRSSILKHDGG